MDDTGDYFSFLRLPKRMQTAMPMKAMPRAESAWMVVIEFVSDVSGFISFFCSDFWSAGCSGTADAVYTLSNEQSSALPTFLPEASIS